ncbi:MAG: hypothetical protein KY475_15405 [Planctomycetes bacterium]|nr:hypothetical protein [Planctomycetota bacterium]
MPSRRFHESFDKLAAEESRFLKTEFLAPVVGGGLVRVRVAGVVCELRAEPAEFTGWGVFRPASHREARLVREAGLAERRRYLELFLRVPLILCRRRGAEWLATPAHQGDQRFRIEGPVPVLLVEEAQQFEVAHCRFDGARFWFEALDAARDPATAAYLRRCLQELRDPDVLDRPGLTPEEKGAYAFNFLLNEEVRRRREIEQTAARLEAALRHAGAELHDYLERPDSYRVTFTVGGRRHISAVEKSDLTVQTAGICLSGEDRKFDLASLVGVLREAEESGEIY